MKIEQGSFQQQQLTKQEAMGLTEEQEIPSEYEDKLLYCDIDRALAQVSREIVEYCLEIFKTYLDMILCKVFQVTLLEQGS